MLKHDSLEDKEEYKEIFEKVEKEVREKFKKENIKKQLGYIHIFDNYKKKILKEKYNIDWKTTQEMNPEVLID